jgi:hypothetical protein
MSADVLSRQTAPPGENLYLRLVQDPFDSIEMARWQMRSRPRTLQFAGPARSCGAVRAAGRRRVHDLAAAPRHGAGWHGRRCPGEVRRCADHRPRVLYHARVVRRNGWIVLHYLYFYFMNDYRSTFGGVNDHESDWEQVFVYLDDAADGPTTGLDRRGGPRLHG